MSEGTSDCVGRPAKGLRHAGLTTDSVSTCQMRMTSQ